MSMACRTMGTTVRNCLNAFQGKVTVNEVYSFSPSSPATIKGEVVIHHTHGHSLPGKSASIWLYSSTEVDPSTGKGVRSDEAHLSHGKSRKVNGEKLATYEIKIHVEGGFGIPGAFVIKNKHKHKFFLQSVTLQMSGHQTIHFQCNSWIYPFHLTKTDRLFFSNTCYLPNQTPESLKKLRQKELESLRGNGSGERNEWDRIYEYDTYNDLGNPNRGPQHVRPVLGGSDSDSHPYPRRLKTGRPPGNQESQSAAINLDMYVPPDERFSPKKESEFISNCIQAALHFFTAEVKSPSQEHSSNFKSLEEIRDLFTSNRRQKVEDTITRKLKSLAPEKLFKEIDQVAKKFPFEFPLPQILAENESAWMEDEEFGRQMLAGTNPTVIRRIQKIPPESTIKQSDIEGNLDGMSFEKAMKQWRILMLDHHDYLMPFLKRINSKGVCAYASRTILFLRNDASLKPLAIELSLPSQFGDREINRVFIPSSEGIKADLWRLAKAHVAVNDSGYHQLINHWLKTHAVVEPFIIATRRQLSVMHPIHRLLDPHFKDTIQINALARHILINSGGILEKTLFTGEFSMELSSALYKDWRFDEQGLPADLLKRSMALKDPYKPSGVHLLFEDYPYAADGVDIWAAIKTFVKDFCSVFYTEDKSVESDDEIQAWWSEIRNVGHHDKCNETWWSSMKTVSDLQEALTTLIWLVSAHHASVNFGQYGYAGYPPNRPTLCQKFIPEEGTLQYAEFLSDPNKYYLRMMPRRSEMTLSVALLEVLSTHTSDEVYLGQQTSEGRIDNERICQIYKDFEDDLQEVEKIIVERNRDPKLKNRWGPAKIPYKLMYPDTSNVNFKRGITGKGIPNSITV